MNPLQTDNLMALSFLIDEEIYVVKNQEEINHPKKEISAPEKEVSAVVLDPLPKAKEEILTNEIPNKEANPAVVEITLPNAKKDFKYLGENNKYILIIVKEPAVDFLKRDDLTFLLKILGAKKLELNDVAIINTEKNDALNFDDLKDFFACNKIITFGIDPKSLQITGAVANKKSVFKNISILGTWDLTRLQQDVNKKTIFWNEFKTF
ncbi:hypothetical protein [Pedobacter cryophilus]|uniref:Uncharacterized protein n=1 Tax=Pedobacter cryophilus TaxID=2571271 RepID=A0A4U1C6I8_9SPHI|nr:hypothetical protein [Pedobacter cryophilus]TKC01029.1 hypothetical protein FA046_04965 [Pedobacter cryophilus]